MTRLVIAFLVFAGGVLLLRQACRRHLARQELRRRMREAWDLEPYRPLFDERARLRDLRGDAEHHDDRRATGT